MVAVKKFRLTEKQKRWLTIADHILIACGIPILLIVLLVAISNGWNPLGMP